MLYIVFFMTKQQLVYNALCRQRRESVENSRIPLRNGDIGKNPLAPFNVAIASKPT